jgi:peptidoglycan/xylan/chitin deacetylase (PgdA/CDA1 family)
MEPDPSTDREVPPVDPWHIRVAHRANLRGRVAVQRLRRIGRDREARWRGVRILLYHRVTSDRGDPLSIANDRFRRQLDLIRRTPDIKLIRLRELYEVIHSDPDGRYVAITLDDGYRDALTDALPILREFDAPATVFLPTGIISGRERCMWYRNPPPFLDWDEVRALIADELVEVQPHGVRHLALPHLSRDESISEITGSIAELQREVGVTHHTYSYAAGRYGWREQDIVRGAGLLGAVTCDCGVNDATVDTTALRRTAVYGHETQAEFRAILGGALDRPSLIRRVRRSVSYAYP